MGFEGKRVKFKEVKNHADPSKRCNCFMRSLGGIIYHVRNVTSEKNIFSVYSDRTLIIMG
jgi:hypothetical protein